MAITSRKITAYTKTHTMLPDVPSPAYTAAQLKSWYDTAPDEARLALNGLIDDLLSTAAGSSGAHNIGSALINGVTGSTVFDQLLDIKAQINSTTLGQIPDGSITPVKLSFDPERKSYAVATGTANTYAVTLNPAATAYVDGMPVIIKINVQNTGASTINVNGLGAKSILKANGSAVPSGSLKVNSVYTLRYNGTSFILQGEGGEYGTATAADVVAPLTIGTDTGLVTGTIADRGTTGNQTLTAQNQSFTVNPGLHRQAFSVTANYIAGKRTATGSIAGTANTGFTVSGLAFRPSVVVVYSRDANKMELGMIVDTPYTTQNGTAPVKIWDSMYMTASATNQIATGAIFQQGGPEYLINSAGFTYYARQTMTYSYYAIE